MPPPKPPQELTQLEVQFLMTAVRLLAVTRTFSPRLPPQAQEAYLMNKVKEEIVSVGNNFKKYMSEPTKILKKPRIHPIIQVMSVEWKVAEAEKRSPDWSIFTTDYISSYCENQRVNELDWHPDLSSLDLGPYLEGLQEHKRWWEVGLPAAQDNEDVHMDPPTLRAPPRAPAAPPMTALPSMPALPVTTRSSKGKARALLTPASSDPRSAPPTLHAPPALPAPPAMPAAPSMPPASPAPYAFRVPRRSPPDDNKIEDFDTTPRKRGGPSDTSIPRVQVDNGSPPPPAQRRRMDNKPLVATGDNRCGPCRNPKNKRPECVSQNNPKRVTVACTESAGRRRLCTPPASWALPIVRFMASQGVAFPEDVQGTLNLSDEGGSSQHSPMSLRSLYGTPGEDLASRVNSLEGKMDYVILVLNAISGKQGIVPSTLPGYIQPPPPHCSPSPSIQSQSSPDIPIASLGISDAHTNAPSGCGLVLDTSASTSRDCQHIDNATTHQANKKIQQGRQHSPVMLSDPIDDSSSDTQSFNEDDMYGSDSGIQSISMKPHSKEEVTISNEVQMNEDQNTEISTQVQRMDINMGNVSIIMDALCEAEGIDISSIANPADIQAATTSHMPSYLEGSNDGNEI
ncbi:hypothetical protein EI94DRAFT_1815345 [Lactarius quietus]|nr:hypothetical protein EI94DRAFT_1815345 [Lactarius quietus]